MTFCYRFFHVEKVCIVESVVKGHFVTHIKKMHASNFWPQENDDSLHVLLKCPLE